MKNLLRNITAGVFNLRYPVGSQFHYYLTPGVSERETVVTRSEAWNMRNGRLVVRVEGKLGGISVNHLEPIV
ncbi:TPA: hypothetical protein NJV01_003358 [Escherichia coli]|nr:hypothetical protein [Escherichia coli]HCG2937281.1 hypothetical protein [Escherichia coli]HCG3100389.1 hypothetical protein [Escherichia coli]